MKSVTAALVHISPLHLRQMLFLGMALLLTLLVSQVVHLWQARQADNQLAAQIVRIHESRAVSMAAPLQTAPLMRSSALPAATADAVAPQERWVF